MFFVIVAFIVAFFFAMNIGASGAAASMGIAYGAGDLRKKTALLICGIGILLGAWIGGERVVQTIGHEIVPNQIISVEIAIIILASATLSLFAANLMGIPLSTSEVTVGAVVGVGIAYQLLFVDHLITIVMFWILVPIIAYILSFFIGRIIKKSKWTLKNKSPGWRKFLVICLVAAGFLEAFSAGMNNVANAIGPLIGAGLMPLSLATITGGLFVALGAYFWGGRVLETNGKKITNLSIPQGIAISSTSGLLVIAASLIGIPMPLTQVTTSAIVGMGSSEKGVAMFQKGVIIRIIKVWCVSPVFSLVIAYGMVKTFMMKDFYTVSVIVSVVIATLGSLSLAYTIKKERQSVHEQGGGI
jgi:sulfate permease